VGNTEDKEKGGDKDKWKETSKINTKWKEIKGKSGY
jgi:hypothetical protein